MWRHDHNFVFFLACIVIQLRYINQQTHTFQTNVLVQLLTMNTWCSKRVEDAKNWIKTLILRVCICWFTLRAWSIICIHTDFGQNLSCSYIHPISYAHVNFIPFSSLRWMTSLFSLFVFRDVKLTVSATTVYRLAIIFIFTLQYVGRVAQSV